MSDFQLIPIESHIADLAILKHRKSSRQFIVKIEIKSYGSKKGQRLFTYREIKPEEAFMALNTKKDKDKQKGRFTMKDDSSLEEIKGFTTEFTENSD